MSKYCSICGKKSDEESNFCKFCGNNFLSNLDRNDSKKSTVDEINVSKSEFVENISNNNNISNSNKGIGNSNNNSNNGIDNNNNVNYNNSDHGNNHISHNVLSQNTKHRNKIILLIGGIAIIAIIVTISVVFTANILQNSQNFLGAYEDDHGLNNFNDGVVSFFYSKEWSQSSIYSKNNDTLVIMKKNESDYVSFFSISRTSSSHSLNEYQNINEKEMLKKSSHISSKAINIDDVEGFEISAKYDVKNGREKKYVGFIKDGYYYSFLFNTKKLSNIESDIDYILSSFKVL
jgi:hypothetical protein